MNVDWPEVIKRILNTEGQQINHEKLENYLENLVENASEYQSTLDWIIDRQQQCIAEVERTSLRNALEKPWAFDETSGNIVHESGGFFKIIGVNVKTNQRESGKGWRQPMFDQGTESSIAGLIRRMQGNIYQYLVEAKFEPGNYGKVLISPSLQVTYSNLNQAHGGKKPKYCEYFDGSKENAKVLYSQWLPEDGGRFYLKRVKYMIVEIEKTDNIHIDDNYRWVQVSTLKKMLFLDNYINPHMRSLLAVL